MTDPYNVDGALRQVATARAHGGEMTSEAARVGDLLADGFRRDFFDADMEAMGSALLVAADSLAPIAQEVAPALAIITSLAMAGENLVRTARDRAAEQAEPVFRSDREADAVLGILTGLADAEQPAATPDAEFGPKWMDWVLTWHPADADAEPVELPLHQHVTLPDGVGELRTTARVISPPSQLPTWEDESDRAYREMVELNRPEVSGG